MRRAAQLFVDSLVYGGAFYGLVRVGWLKIGGYLGESQEDDTAKRMIISHYEQSREESLSLIMALLPELERVIQARFAQIEPTMARLRELRGTGDGAREIKLELWGLLKVDVLSRSVAVIYAVSLLSLLYSIQLSIIGRLLYLRRLFRLRQILPSTFLPGLGDLEGEDEGCMEGVGWSREILQSSRHLVQVGLGHLLEAIHNSVGAVMSRISLTDAIEPDQIESIIEQVRHEIEAASGRSIIEDAMLAPNDYDDGSPKTQTILANMAKAELRATIKSKEFKEILSEHLNERFTSLSHAIHFPDPPSLTVIQVIPQISKHFYTECSESIVKKLHKSPKMERMTANIFINYHGGANNKL